MPEDIASFKKRLRQQTKKIELEIPEVFKKWKRVKQEQQELEDIDEYRPKSKLTVDGYIVFCPNCHTKLDSIFAANLKGFLGWWEYSILSCPTCEYEYAEQKRIK